MGCRLNIYEGEIIRSHLKKNNLSNFTVINSCAVTENAEKKVRYEIRKAKKRFPNKKIVLTGCAAQIFPQKYSKIKEVDYLIGNIEKINSQTWSNINDSNPVQVKNIFKSDKAHYNVIKKFNIELSKEEEEGYLKSLIYGRGVHAHNSSYLEMSEGDPPVNAIKLFKYMKDNGDYSIKEKFPELLRRAAEIIASKYSREFKI